MSERNLVEYLVSCKDAVTYPNPGGSNLPGNAVAIYRECEKHVDPDLDYVMFHSFNGVNYVDLYDLHGIKINHVYVKDTLLDVWTRAIVEELTTMDDSIWVRIQYNNNMLSVDWHYKSVDVIDDFDEGNTYFMISDAYHSMDPDYQKMLEEVWRYKRDVRQQLIQNTKPTYTTSVGVDSTTRICDVPGISFTDDQEVIVIRQEDGSYLLKEL